MMCVFVCCNVRDVVLNLLQVYMCAYRCVCVSGCIATLLCLFWLRRHVFMVACHIAIHTPFCLFLLRLCLISVPPSF